MSKNAGPGQRKEDIPALAQHFLTLFSEKNRRKMKGFSPDAMDAMIRYDWEGNVRELSNCLERAVVLARTDYVCKEDLSFIKTEAYQQSQDLDLSNIRLSKIEEHAICSTLEAAQGNKSEAARRLGITRKTLLKKLKTYQESKSDDNTGSN